jgi:hypothetical protein
MCDAENRNRGRRIRVCEEEDEGLKLARNIRDVTGVLMKLVASLPCVSTEGRGFTS